MKPLPLHEIVLPICFHLSVFTYAALSLYAGVEKNSALLIVASLLLALAMPYHMFFMFCLVGANKKFEQKTRDDAILLTSIVTGLTILMAAPSFLVAPLPPAGLFVILICRTMLLSGASGLNLAVLVVVSWSGYLVGTLDFRGGSWPAAMGISLGANNWTVLNHIEQLSNISKNNNNTSGNRGERVIFEANSLSVAVLSLEMVVSCICVFIAVHLCKRFGDLAEETKQLSEEACGPMVELLASTLTTAVPPNAATAASVRSPFFTSTRPPEQRGIPIQALPVIDTTSFPLAMHTILTFFVQATKFISSTSLLIESELRRWARLSVDQRTLLLQQQQQRWRRQNQSRGSFSSSSNVFPRNNSADRSLDDEQRGFPMDASLNSNSASFTAEAASVLLASDFSPFSFLIPASNVTVLAIKIVNFEAFTDRAVSSVRRSRLGAFRELASSLHISLCQVIESLNGHVCNASEFSGTVTAFWSRNWPLPPSSEPEETSRRAAAAAAAGPAPDDHLHGEALVCVAALRCYQLIREVHAPAACASSIPSSSSPVTAANAEQGQPPLTLTMRAGIHCGSARIGNVGGDDGGRGLGRSAFVVIGEARHVAETLLERSSRQSYCAACSSTAAALGHGIFVSSDAMQAAVPSMAAALAEQKLIFASQSLGPLLRRRTAGNRPQQQQQQQQQQYSSHFFRGSDWTANEDDYDGELCCLGGYCGGIQNQQNDNAASERNLRVFKLLGVSARPQGGGNVDDSLRTLGAHSSSLLDSATFRTNSNDNNSSGSSSTELENPVPSTSRPSSAEVQPRHRFFGDVDVTREAEGRNSSSSSRERVPSAVAAGDEDSSSNGNNSTSGRGWSVARAGPAGSEDDDDKFQKKIPTTWAPSRSAGSSAGSATIKEDRELFSTLLESASLGSSFRTVKSSASSSSQSSAGSRKHGSFRSASTLAAAAAAAEEGSPRLLTPALFSAARDALSAIRLTMYLPEWETELLRNFNVLRSHFDGGAEQEVRALCQSMLAPLDPMLDSAQFPTLVENGMTEDTVRTCWLALEDGRPAAEPAVALPPPSAPAAAAAAAAPPPGETLLPQADGEYPDSGGGGSSGQNTAMHVPSPHQQQQPVFIMSPAAGVAPHLLPPRYLGTGPAQVVLDPQRQNGHAAAPQPVPLLTEAQRAAAAASSPAAAAAGGGGPLAVSSEGRQYICIQAHNGIMPSQEQLEAIFHDARQRMASAAGIDPSRLLVRQDQGVVAHVPQGGQVAAVAQAAVAAMQQQQQQQQLSG